MEHQSRKAAVPDLTEHPHYLKQIYKLLPPCNLIYADKDLVVRYMNQASRNTLAKIEHLLPCKVDEMIGKSIDIFHQTPARARQVLASEKNLPHHAYIQLGQEKIEQTIHPVYDEKGALVGYATAWPSSPSNTGWNRRCRPFSIRGPASSSTSRAMSCAPTTFSCG